VFIAKGREDHPALSYHGIGQGGVGRLCAATPALQDMVFFFFQRGDKVKRHGLH